MNRFEKSFRQKRTSTKGNTRAKFDSIRFEWRHHMSKKGRCFFICPSITLFLRYSSFISLEDLGRKISGLLTPNDLLSYFFWISAENGRIWRKSEKRGFLDGQKQANMAIFVPRPQVSLTISQCSIIFFLLEDMSVMFLSLLTNSVGLKGKELGLFPNW